MLECAVLTVLPAWWAMAVQQRARGQGTTVVLIKGLAFALFQLAVMVGLIRLNAWWADLIFLFLLLATGNMVLEAVALRYPDSVICQGRCHGLQAAVAVSFGLLGTGLSQTTPGLDQSLVGPRQRSGRAALAC